MPEEDVVANFVVRGMESFSAAMRTAKQHVEETETGAIGLTKRLHSTGIGLGDVGGAAVTAAKGLAGIGAAATGWAFKTGFAFNDQLEQAQGKFALFTKNAQETQMALDAVDKVARTSTFARPELSEVVAQLGFAGVKADDLGKGLQGVANAAIAAGGGSAKLSQVSGILGKLAIGGNASAATLRQLAQAGLPVYDVLQRKLKLTANEVQKIGEQGIDARTVYQALTEEFTSGKMAEAAKRQAETTGGQWHNVMGVIRKEMGNLTKPVYDWVGAKALPEIRSQLPQVFAGFRTGIAQGFGALPAATSGLTGAGDAAWKFGSVLRTVGKVVIDAAKAFGSQFGPAIKDFFNALKPLAPVFSNILFPLIKGFVTGVLGVFIGAIKVATLLLRIFGPALGAIGKAAKPLKPVFEAIGFILGTIFGPSVLGWIFKVTGSIGQFGGIFGRILAVLIAPMRAVLGIFTLWAGALGGLVSQLGNFGGVIGSVFGFMLNIVKSVWGWISSNWPLLLAILSGPIGLAILFVVNNFGKIRDTVSSVFNSVVGFAASLPGRFAGALSSLASKIVEPFKKGVAWARDQLNWIVDRVKELPSKIGSAVMGVVDAIVKPFKDAAGAVGGVLSSINPFAATGKIVAAQSGYSAGRGTNVLVGERGPELLSLPSGSRVTPLPPPALAGSAFSGGTSQIVVPVYLDRRQIAEAFGEHVSDQQARR